MHAILGTVDLGFDVDCCGSWLGDVIISEFDFCTCLVIVGIGGILT